MNKDMPSLTREQIIVALAQIKTPQGESLAQDTYMAGLHITPQAITLALTIAPTQVEAFKPVQLAAQQALSQLAGATPVYVVLSAERVGASAPPAPASPLPQVKKIIAVASGKGGVGKSTTAVNLALALQARGLQVGMLDADIYGPSLPKLLGLKAQPEVDGKTLIPMQAYGLKVMSMGLMVADDAPLIWRGPMLDSALTQLLLQVAWGALDVLIIDMPPGTGDAHLAVMKKVPLTGAVIVSTPQDLALLDARKGMALFQQAGVPILGLIENMAYFICPTCGTACDIFDHHGVRTYAQAQGVPFLGEVPLHMTIRQHSDAGHPIVIAAPDSPQAKAYHDIAAQLQKDL